jgi:hypothetical protein
VLEQKALIANQNPEDGCEEENTLSTASDDEIHSEDSFNVDPELFDDADAQPMSALLSLPYELQVQIIMQLISDPNYINHLLAFGSSAKLPKRLMMDFQVWSAIADYWLSPQHFPTLSRSKLAKTLQMFAQAGRNHLISLLDPNYEHLYHVNGKALVAAGNAADTQSMQVFLDRLQENPYPHYIGEALKAVCAKGSLEQSMLLLTALLRKNKHTRDYIITHACKIALENAKWDIVSLLLKQDACLKDSALLGKVLLQAGKENMHEIVKQILQMKPCYLSFMDKWAVKSTPGFIATGISIDDLFSNDYWFIRAPIHYLVSQPLPQADLDDVAELLASVSLEDKPKRGPRS